MDFTEQVRLLKRSRQVHANWYLTEYRDVAQLGMDPAEHYLKYGAELGRNPGKDFDTRYYLDSYPQVAERGMNPLLHYVLEGQSLGYEIRDRDKWQAERMVREVETIRTKLLSLGFTDRPLADLAEIVETCPHPAARAAAARELALWHMRQKTPEGYRTALDHIATTRRNDPDLEFRRKLVTVELMCHYFLGQWAEGREVFERASLDGEISPDANLAWANFQTTPEGRCDWINQVMTAYGIPEVGLTGDQTLPPYDRLTVPEVLPAIPEGPMVSVLIAAYEAADMLPTALRSLQAQTWKNLEILVIDDCSPDDGATCAVAERFAAEDPRIRLIRMPENGGAYVARNRGLDEAKGEFVTIHDADDWSHPVKIEQQMRYMQENPKKIGCTSEQARASNELEFSKIRSNGAFVIFNTSSFLFRKDPVRETLGYWDTARFGADNEMIRRMQAAFGGWALGRLRSGPLSFQREASSSVTEDPVKGVQGFYYGVRHEYFAAQLDSHRRMKRFKYDGDPDSQSFPRPAMMNSRNRPAKDHVEHYHVIVAGDFRVETDKVREILDRIAALSAEGRKVGVVYHYDYELQTIALKACDRFREVATENGVPVIVFGDRASCDLLLGPDITQPENRLRYTPEIVFAREKASL